MKVLWVFSHPAPYKIDFFNELGKSIDLTVLFERKSEKNHPLAFYSVKTQNFKCKFIRSLKIGKANNLSWDLTKEIRNHHYDIIVINGWSTFSEMKVLRYLHSHKIPYIFAINGGIAKIKEPHCLSSLKHKYIAGASLYLAPDPHSAQYLTYYGADVSKIEYYTYSTIFEKDIPESYATESERNSLKRGLGLPEGEIFISVGSFAPRKNENQLLRLWTKVDSKKTLLLLGGGSEENVYRKFVKKKNLNNVIIRSFVPHQEVLKFFRLADASIFLTKEDIYGHVVNESLSQGTPVLASKNSNSALKLIESGINGYVFGLDDTENVIKTINRGISDQMRSEAIKTARNNTIEKMVKEHLEIFSKFLKQ